MAIDRASHKRKKGTPVRPDEDPSPAQVDVFFNMFVETLSEYRSRMKAGISRAKLAEMKGDPAFLKRYKDARADLVERVEDAAYERAVNRGDKDLIKLILQARNPENYGPKASINVNIDIERLKAMSKEELIELRDQLNKAR